MQLVKKDVNGVVLAFSMDELATISNALNESLEAIEEWEFATRMGATRAEAEHLLSTLNRIILERTRGKIEDENEDDGGDKEENKTRGRKG